MLSDAIAVFHPEKTTNNELIICIKSRSLSDLANCLAKMIFKETVDKKNR